MTRTFLTPSQRRALAAAAGLVGRPHLRAGLAVTLAVACVPLDDPGTGESAGDTATTATSDDGSSSTIGGPTVSGSASSDGGGATTGVATTSAGTSTGDDGTTIGTTAGTTLLTDASTSQATTDGDTTGDDTTAGTTGETGTTGDLRDCKDPRSGEVDWACCEAQNWEPVPQCTPWGPPAPPSVDAALLGRARAARGRWV